MPLELPAPVPLRRGLRHLAAATVARLTGWRFAGRAPGCAKAVIVAAPHTSNWDFMDMLLISWWYGLRMSWLGKHTLFRGPAGWFLRLLGGIPVDRRAPGGLVGILAREFQRRERLYVVIPAEGTRSARPAWKSGFYRVAIQAGVPIVMGFDDYRTRSIGFGPCFEPTGDLRRDMDRVRGFYGRLEGRHPELQGPIRLLAEE